MIIATPFFGTNQRYAEMLSDWKKQAESIAPDLRIITLTTEEYPIDEYADLIRLNQPFDTKGAIMCAAALAIQEPFLMLDSDAFLMRDPRAALSREECMAIPCAMPCDHGSIIHNHGNFLLPPYESVRKTCAGVFLFGNPASRPALVAAYRTAYHELKAANFPWMARARLTHLLEQYSWSLASHRMGGGILQASFNWNPDFLGENPYCYIKHLYGWRKHNGNAPANV